MIAVEIVKNILSSGHRTLCDFLRSNRDWCITKDASRKRFCGRFRILGDPLGLRVEVIREAFASSMLSVGRSTTVNLSLPGSGSALSDELGIFIRIIWRCFTWLWSGFLAGLFVFGFVFAVSSAKKRRLPLPQSSTHRCCGSRL